MTHEEFTSEKDYQIIMSIARMALQRGIIEKDEYGKIETAFIGKYKPVIGSLFSDISLTSAVD